MIKDREYSFIAEEEGRVDIVGVNALNIPRSVFSNPTIFISVDGKECKKSRKLKIGEKVFISYKEKIIYNLEK